MRILLSDQIISSVRASIGHAFPGTKASHRAEALAAGFGFRNNAALLAYLAPIPRYEVRLNEADIGAFQRRLSELSETEIRDDGALSAAIGAAGAAVRTEGYDTLSNSGREKFFARSQVGDWHAPSMSNAERFAYMAFLLRWRMMNAGVANFVADYADVVPVHLHIAAASQANPNYDPEIAAFLADWLVAAGTREDVEWGDRIYEAARFRIFAYLDALCLSWDEAVDPMSITPVAAAARPRLKGEPSISLSLKPGSEFSLWQVGQVEPSHLELTGLALMAHWRTGISHDALSQMTQRLQERALGIGVPPGTKIFSEAGALVSWEQARGLIRRSHALDDMAPGKKVDWDNLDLLPTDAAGADKAAGLLEAAGFSFAKLPDDDGFRSAMMAAVRRDAYAIIVNMAGREIGEILPVMASGMLVITSNLDLSSGSVLLGLTGFKVLTPQGDVVRLESATQDLSGGGSAAAQPLLRASSSVEVTERTQEVTFEGEDEPEAGIKPLGRG